MKNKLILSLMNIKANSRYYIKFSCMIILVIVLACTIFGFTFALYESSENQINNNIGSNMYVIDGNVDINHDRFNQTLNTSSISEFTTAIDEYIDTQTFMEDDKHHFGVEDLVVKIDGEIKDIPDDVLYNSLSLDGISSDDELLTHNEQTELRLRTGSDTMLAHGRLPELPNEVLLSYHFAETYGLLNAVDKNISISFSDEQYQLSVLDEASRDDNFGGYVIVGVISEEVNQLSSQYANFNLVMLSTSSVFSHVDLKVNNYTIACVDSFENLNGIKQYLDSQDFEYYYVADFIWSKIDNLLNMSKVFDKIISVITILTSIGLLIYIMMSVQELITLKRNSFGIGLSVGGNSSGMIMTTLIEIAIVTVIAGVVAYLLSIGVIYIVTAIITQVYWIDILISGATLAKMSGVGVTIWAIFLTCISSAAYYIMQKLSVIDILR